MKSYLKYLCASFLALMSGMAYAQNEECVTLDVSYSMTVSGTPVLSGDAVVMVQGDAYMLGTGGMEIYCDGSDLWVVNPDTKEVYVQSADSAVESYMPGKPSDLLKALSGRSEATFGLNDGQEISIKVNSIEKEVGNDDVSSFRPPYDFDYSWALVDLR